MSESDAEAQQTRLAIVAALNAFETKQTQSAQEWRQGISQQLETLKANSIEAKNLKEKLVLAGDDAPKAMTRPPVDSPFRQDFLSRLESAVNEAYHNKGEGFTPITLPQDYKILLSLTDGLDNPNLDDAAVLHISGIKETTVEKMMDRRTRYVPASHHLSRLGWDLGSGFWLGEGMFPDPHWFGYFYCARAEMTAFGPKAIGGDIKPYEREWKWRIFYKEPERWHHSFSRPMVFESLVEWLAWYQDWWNRVSIDYPAWMAENLRMVEMVYGSDHEDQLGDLGPE